MEEFTAYLFGPDGHIVQRVSLICADVDAAKERAEQPAETYAAIGAQDRQLSATRSVKSLLLYS
jgi:hypothetical protein